MREDTGAGLQRAGQQDVVWSWGGSRGPVGKGTLGSGSQSLNPTLTPSSLCDVGKSLDLSEPQLRCVYRQNTNRICFEGAVLRSKFPDKARPAEARDRPEGSLCVRSAVVKGGPGPSCGDMICSSPCPVVAAEGLGQAPSQL